MNTRDSWDRLYAGDDRPWKGEPEAFLPTEGSVLELGVGNGKGLSAFSLDAVPIGLDFSRQALISCRRWHSLPLIQGNVTALPFKDGSFPFVSASHVLGHLIQEERRKAAQEMVRVMTQGGSIYINVFGEGDMRCGKGTEIEERTYERGNGIVCHYFLPGEIGSLFPGLKVIRNWERCVHKRYHGQEEVRQERRYLLRLE
ncbi:MAG TPA: class I SAM-dependent methyltransferase [Methanomassiliicoccales archaeon]|nr:class I SAM-dependent methyltransferase [Methanomassiliicoccales archaeon]